MVECLLALLGPFKGDIVPCKISKRSQNVCKPWNKLLVIANQTEELLHFLGCLWHWHVMY